MGVGEDRISELPDSILHEILSFFPTKCAVSTSILSKRWRWLWTGVPVLGFAYLDGSRSDPNKARMFMNYVDRVLLHHHMSNISSFWLLCDEACDESRVNSWISTVAHQKLQELDLCFRTERPYVIPHSVYSCESLTVLKITFREGVFSVFNLPTSISLPSLTTLELCFMILMDRDLTQKFFSSLPALEHLALHFCTWVNHEILVISVPSLNHLSIRNASYRGSVEHKIKICAPKLDYLHYSSDKIPREYILFDMPFLGEACINADNYYSPLMTQEEAYNYACNLLKALVNVEFLYIPGYILQFLQHEDLMSRLPIFANLTYLQVFKTCHGNDLLSLLRIMPNLEYLFFDKAYASTEDELTSHIEEMLPQCFQSRLKVVRIMEYDGSIEELSIIKFLLKNVLALENIDIINGFEISGDLSKIREHILMIPRGSVNCVVEFSENPVWVHKYGAGE